MPGTPKTPNAAPNGNVWMKGAAEQNGRKPRSTKRSPPKKRSTRRNRRCGMRRSTGRRTRRSAGRRN
jgi:hypothetical protein